MDTPRHSVSVAGAVINDEGKILAIRRADNGHWEPPGGVLELDETIEDGLVREIHEETGLTVELERLTGVYKNVARGIVALVFRCHPVAGNQHASVEADQVAWLDRQDVEKRMEPVYAIRILDALHSGLTTIRAHDGRTIF